MRRKNRTQPQQLLDQKAKQLAQRHQHRLAQMTETALTTAPNHTRWLSSQPALTFATLSIAVVAWWTIATPDNERVSEITSQMAVIPAWVLDEEVPLELLEAPEFYRWLAEQNPSEEPSEKAQRG